MVVFSDKQMKILRGSHGNIAEATGCSVVYVRSLLKGRRSKNSELAKKVIEKCQELIKVLEA